MIALNKTLDFSDFADPDLIATLRDIFPHEMTRFGHEWPIGHEYRKDWEIGIAVLALKRAGALHQNANILGVGAGNEPTIFYLTNLVRSVHATDLYLPTAPRQPVPQLPPGFKQRLRDLASAAKNVFSPQPAPRVVDWTESANINIFLDPGRYWPRAWNPRRLVVQHMNALDLKYEDDTFDGIFSSGSIEHFGDHAQVQKAAREMARVLKPGGVLTVSTEFRLSGPGPGMPGTLMFSEAELIEHIVVSSGLQPLDQFDPKCSPKVGESAQEFTRMSGHVQSHVAEHGEILFHKLTWPEYPHVALHDAGRIWTSCHLALRKAK